MKKHIMLYIIITLILTGCSVTEKQKITINNPYEVAINNKILSYYDTKEDVPIEFNVLDTSFENIQKVDNNALVDSDNKIRRISITDKNVITYNQISVGDNVSKIEDNYLYEYKFENIYMVIFNGNQEESPTNQNKGNDWIWITYIIDDSKISQIQIYDVKYGFKFQ